MTFTSKSDYSNMVLAARFLSLSIAKTDYSLVRLVGGGGVLF